MNDAPLPLDGTVVVAGGCLAGLRAAQGLRDHGFRGRLVLVGDERHPPYDRPPLSKQVLAGKWPPERAMLAGFDELDRLGVEAHLGRRAEHLDAEARRVTLDDGAEIQADGIVVATGAHARRLPGLAGEPAGPGGAGGAGAGGLRDVGAAAPTTVLRTLDDAINLRDRVRDGAGCRVVVVGAGFIGSEVAATCAGLGCQVTVLESLPTPLAAAVGDVVGAACGALHRRHGVDVRTGAPVAAVRPGAVDLRDGTSVPADLVVVGIGVEPNVGWLEGSGMTVEDGVVCDHALFAADGVVAAGDVARWAWRRSGADAGSGERSARIEHWEVASQMGAAAARSLLAGRAAAEPFDPVPYFWSDQYGLRIQVLGRPDPGDGMAVVDGDLDAPDSKFVVIYGRAGRLTAALAIGRPRQLMAFRPLLGAGASWDEALGLLGGP